MVNKLEVNKLEEYPWSSYGHNALAKGNSILSPHKLYLQLGENEVSRKAAYQHLFQTCIDSAMLEEVRACLQSGTPLGNDHFRAQIEQALKVKVGQAKRGRPRQNKL
jgi:putative transposase